MPNVSYAALGSGLPHKAVEALSVGTSDGASIAATGDDETNAAALGLDAVITVTGADDAVGVFLNDDLPDRSIQYIVNTGAATLLLYPSSGGTINGLSANAAYTIGDNQTAIIGRRNATTWLAVSDPAT
jgi:hypothetical protein